MIPSDYTGFVKFSAEWCGPCKTASPVIRAVAKANNIELMEIDIDQDTETPSKYGVRTIPSLISFKDGEPLGVLTGSHSEDKYESFASESGFYRRVNGSE